MKCIICQGEMILRPSSKDDGRCDKCDIWTTGWGGDKKSWSRIIGKYTLIWNATGKQRTYTEVVFNTNAKSGPPYEIIRIHCLLPYDITLDKLKLYLLMN
jgi:hypothetical protein